MKPYAWLALAVAAVYLRILGFGFTYLDDNALILDNWRFLSSWSSVTEAFRQDVFYVTHSAQAYYRPVFMLSLISDAHLWGPSAAGFHFANILWHLAASCVLLRLLLRLGHADGPALFCALLFAVHPGLTQAVAWIPARNDSMLGLFVFGSFLSFLAFLEGGGWRPLAAHAALFALALLTKETAAALVLACAAWLLLKAKDWPSSRRTAALLAGWALTLALWYALRSAALGNPLKLSLSQMAHSLWLNLPGLVHFAGKAVLPFNLSVVPILQDTGAVLGVLSIALVGGLYLLPHGRDSRAALFGLCWFCLFLLPSFVLHSTSVADFMMEQRLYVPMAGFLMVLLETAPLKSPPPPAAGAVVLCFYAALAFRHSGHFRDRLTFWRNAVQTSPHLPLAHRNLAAMYYLDGDLARAAPELERALELNPAEPMAHNNLGLIYARRGLLKEAEEEYRKELGLNPGYDNAHFNLGLLCYRQARYQEAAALWKRTLEINPDHADAWSSLAILYFQLRQPAEGARAVREMRRKGMPVPAQIANLVPDGDYSYPPPTESKPSP